MKRIILVMMLAIIFGFTALAEATLFDRGGGLIYCDTLDITWLQNANYAKTSGRNADGKLKWILAVSWANQLVYGDYNDWRLPSALDQSGRAPLDPGYVIAESEMYYLYHTEGIKSSTSTPFFNVLTNYWSGTECVTNTPEAWYFGFNHGIQTTGPKNGYEFYAWPVRDGDVNPVPVPATFLLLLSGLIGMVGIKKKVN